jgi:hypothetical protein
LDAQAARFHAHDRVYPRVVGFLAIEDFHAEQIFLEFSRAAAIMRST